MGFNVNDDWLRQAVGAVRKLRKARLKVAVSGYDSRSLILRVRGLPLDTIELHMLLPSAGLTLTLEDFRRGEVYVAALNKALSKGDFDATRRVKHKAVRGGNGKFSPYRAKGILRSSRRLQENGRRKAKGSGGKGTGVASSARADGGDR